MWVEIILSLITGWLVGVTYTNFDLLRPYLARYFPGLSRRRERQRMPPIYCVPRDTKPDSDSEPEECAGECPGSNDALQAMLSSLSQPATTNNFDDKVKAFEEKNNSKVVFINHGRQKNSVMGIDLNLFGTNDTLNTSDARALLDILRETPKDTDIDLILHTTGGSMAAAEVMVKALLAHNGKIRVHIPYYAQSAGTLLALTGNEIHIGRGGWLTQVDPQLGYVSAASVLQYTNTTNEQIATFGNVPLPQRSWFSDLASLIHVSAEKAMNRAIELMNYISTARGHSEKDGEHLTDLLVKGVSNHDKPLTEDLLIGVPGLSFGVSDDVMNLYKAHCERR